MDRCKDFCEYLAACADGELKGELDERVRRHLEVCERCRLESRGLRKVVELYRESVLPEVPAEDWEKVRAALERRLWAPVTGRATVPGHAVRRHFFGWWLLPATGLAAAVLLVALVIGLSGARTSLPTAQVNQLETGSSYEAMVRLPVNEDDVLVIDVVQAE